MVRQSIAGQCSNNSNGSHATLLEVVIIIIIVMIIIIYKMIKDWYFVEYSKLNLRILYSQVITFCFMATQYHLLEL